ncbi:MAG: PEPxxWA-CTERM sorting domain-containing protein [Caulobacteraceae bacterium]
MKSALLGGLALAAVMVGAAPASATLITFTPGDVAVPVSPPFGNLVPGGDLGTKYKAFGVDFTYGGVEGVFNDPPLAFGGVNASGQLDLVSPVDGRIVLLNTLTPATTDLLYAEAGSAAVGSLTLTVYDSLGNVLATALNGPPNGPHGRTTFQINTPGIAAFKISGADTFGVDEIHLDTPTGGGVPEPMTWALMLVGLGGVGVALRRRQTVPQAA